jgi:hypothetical protein
VPVACGGINLKTLNRYRLVLKIHSLYFNKGSTALPVSFLELLKMERVAQRGEWT